MRFRLNRIGKFVCLLSVTASLYCTSKPLLQEPLVYSPQGIEKLRKRYDLTPNYDAPPFLNQVKVAILDEGFGGITAETMEKYLPKNSKIFDLADSTIPGIEPMSDSIHGLHMAQIVWAMAALSKQGPQIGLFNMNGPDNQMAAIKAAIDWGAHIVVQSANFEMFGNMNGTGWINEHVDHAIANGIIWLNTVGNYRGLVYNGPVKLDSRKEFVRFAGDVPYLRFHNKVALNKLKIVLNWDSYSVGNPLFQRPKGTNKDLDLYIGLEGDLDKDGNQIWKGVADDEQVISLSAQGNTKETLYAREVVYFEAQEQKKDYLIAVKRKGGAFTADDKLRVTVYPLDLSKRTFDNPRTRKKEVRFSFESATKGFEIMTPADGKGLTIGSSGEYSSLGPTVDYRGKPEILTLNNDVLFSDKAVFDGESASNAILGGIAAVLKGTELGLKQHHLLKFRSTTPEKVYEDLGWQKEPIRNFVNRTEISDFLAKYIADDSMRVKGSGREATIGLLSNRKDAAKLRGYLEEEGYDFKKHRIYIAVREERDDYIAFLCRTEREDFKPPWETKLAKTTVGNQFYEIVEIRAAGKPFVGNLQDGTDNDARFWKTPTPEKLRQVVRGG